MTRESLLGVLLTLVSLALIVALSQIDQQTVRHRADLAAADRLQAATATEMHRAWVRLVDALEALQTVPPVRTVTVFRSCRPDIGHDTPILSPTGLWGH